MPLATVEEAIEEIRQGNFVIIVDDEDRENEGDLSCAAELITPEMINFMAQYGRGLVCLSIVGERLDELGIPLMVKNNTASFSTAFTESVDAKYGATTGISAYDRAATIKAMLDPETNPEDLARPGHVFPLRYREGGVLMRAGQTEGIVDLARLAGLYPAGVICEVMRDDGHMARMPDLEAFSQNWGVKIVTIAQLIAYRRRQGGLVERVAEAVLPTRHGDFTAYGYKSSIDTDEQIALVMGDIDPEAPTLVRVHSECVTGDVLGSLRCDCGQQVDLALEQIAREGIGVFVYIRQEGRGIGLHNKIRAYALQDVGLDTVEANQRLGFPPDLRDHGVGAQILVNLGVRKMRLMTNNPRKLVAIEAYDLEVVEMVPIQPPPNIHNIRYLQTKRDKMGHMLNLAFGDTSGRPDEPEAGDG